MLQFRGNGAQRCKREPRTSHERLSSHSFVVGIITTILTRTALNGNDARAARHTARGRSKYFSLLYSK
jgi:hypothetical protein